MSIESISDCKKGGEGAGRGFCWPMHAGTSKYAPATKQFPSSMKTMSGERRRERERIEGIPVTETTVLWPAAMSMALAGFMMCGSSVGALSVALSVNNSSV